MNVRTLLILVMVVFLLSACGADVEGEASWACTRFTEPYEEVFFRDEVIVYDGTDEPTMEFKQVIVGGSAQLLAQCTGSSGSYYRVRGGSWSGWVNTRDAQRGF
jgi:hypothetical protein